MKGLRAGEGFVLRTPFLPLSELAAWRGGGDEAASRRYLVDVVARPEVSEAIFLASPSLHAALDAWREAPLSPTGQRIERSLTKYVSRMMGRATPFGLFSGVAAGKLGTLTKLELGPMAEYRRRTRLDNDYMFVLLEELARDTALRARLRHKPNSSIYRAGGRLRYACAQLAGTERRYHLMAVESTPHLEAALASATRGLRPGDIAAVLCNDEVTVEMADDYVNELIDAQLLVPELCVNVTGAEPIDVALAQLAATGLDVAPGVLARVRERLRMIDARGLGNTPDDYAVIAADLGELPTKVELGRLFQTDMTKPASAVLGVKVAATVATALTKLAQLASSGSVFYAWKLAFRDRWQDRWLPLADVLDEESGIGFETPRGPGTEGAPLLAGLAFDRASAGNDIRWPNYYTHLAHRLAEALAAGHHEISLDDADIDAMKSASPAPLPDAFSALIRLAGDPKTPTILLEGMTGPSGARLLGRFCHASPEIEAIVRAHLAIEEAHHPEAVFAEIVHLNEGRIGNILSRPVLRDYEIVYLGESGASRERQIPLEDLLVGIDGGRIVLWSQRLGREVIPRLTAAHNFWRRSLVVYRFLCALASQNAGAAQFAWGPLAAAPYLPRVRIGDVVVQRARWNLVTRDLVAITAAVRTASENPESRGVVLEAVDRLARTRKLPRTFVVQHGDNELPIDLDNPLLVYAFADEVAGAAAIAITELFPQAEKLLVSGPEGGFANELVLTFTQSTATPPRRSIASRPTVDGRCIEFGPGSEWLFAKIYCGEDTADRILCEAVGPVVRDAMASRAARQWFFLRYHDPEPHLRVRFRGDPARLLTEVLPALHASLEQHIRTGAARKLVLDTYAREVNRYGGHHGIELVEEIFWRDSAATLGILELLEGDAGAVARWKLALRGIDSLLEAVGLSEVDRALVITRGREALSREFDAGPALWSQIGDLFVRERRDLLVMFERDEREDAAHEFAEPFALLTARDAAIAAIAPELQRRDRAGELTTPLLDFAWSLVHMHANRMLHASQRAQEMVLYDLLRRLHAGRRAQRAQDRRRSENAG